MLLALNAALLGLVSYFLALGVQVIRASMLKVETMQLEQVRHAKDIEAHSRVLDTHARAIEKLMEGDP